MIDANGFDDAFYKTLKAQAPQHGIVPIEFLKLVACECDLYAHVKNRYGYAGITQIGPAELKELGWEGGSFEEALPSVQLSYSFKYFDGWRHSLADGQWHTAGLMWTANLAPAHVGRPDGLVYSRATSPGQYAANRWTDVDGNGVIDTHDLDAAIKLVIGGWAPGRHQTAARYQLAISRLEAA